MSEFSIDRPPKISEPSRHVNSSGATDADGGGGYSFVFHGGASGQPDEKGQNAHNAKKMPPPPGDPVKIELSATAVMSLTGNVPEGKLGALGRVTPPPEIAPSVEKSLRSLEQNGYDGQPANQGNTFRNQNQDSPPESQSDDGQPRLKITI